MFTVSIFLFILFIDGCTELGDTNEVTTIAVNVQEFAAPFVEHLQNQKESMIKIQKK